ncbi:UDP-N-acetylmuramoyl-tripeptide--D-alanyl-D-alanine ligase [Chromobacterium violaceum]|uniref:UDP-N-acetylmuramoyl-tripeptide--D-alanyl-D-alanine ligase n=1 Tax=Chromobacterium violaceum TaxID=536 RepID=A0A447TLH1_CHRVL|nr:UDP-N-acetylmuramoyl-tripeptide--D-alanyl-D-alanine ligase [Chromobacterium violaceum]
MALVNNAMRAHFGHFGSTEDVARAKAEIFEGLIDGGVAVVNADDANLPLFRAAAGSHRQLSFGLGLADVSARDLALSALDSRFTLVSPAGQLAVSLPAPGEHNVRNALAAAAAALALEVPLAAIAEGLSAFAGAKGRLQIKQSPRGLTVIDDSYNANPDSMKAGIDVLAGLPGPRCFVMGDIGELGEAAPALHAEVGEHARLRGIEQLFALARPRAARFRPSAAPGRVSIRLTSCWSAWIAGWLRVPPFWSRVALHAHGTGGGTPDASKERGSLRCCFGWLICWVRISGPSMSSITPRCAR